MIGLYRLMDWKDKVKTMRASTIKKKVEKARDNNKGRLFAPPSEIIKVCNAKNFPDSFAYEIKILIIDYFSKIQDDKFDLFLEKEMDKQAVYYAYNSLFKKDDEKTKKVKVKFLESFLIGIERDTYLYIIHPNETYLKIRNNWIKNKLELFESQDILNFYELRVTLAEEFKGVIKEAEEKGLFKEDYSASPERIENVTRILDQEKSLVLKKSLKRRS